MLTRENVITHILYCFILRQDQRKLPGYSHLVGSLFLFLVRSNFLLLVPGRVAIGGHPIVRATFAFPFWVALLLSGLRKS